MFEQVIGIRHGELGEDYLPSTVEEANTFFFLGEVRRDIGALKPAFDAYAAGLSALEAQTLRSDFSEDVRVTYRGEYEHVYRKALSAGIDAKRSGDSLHILERYRTQSLLSLLDWSSAAKKRIPEAYREELVEIGQRYDQITRQLDRTYPEVDQELLAKQAALRRRREVIQGQIIRERQESGEIPRALEVDDIRQQLDPGTLMLAYSIGNAESYVFVLDREGPLEVHPIETEALRMWIQVAQLRKTDIQPVDSSAEARLGISHWLYEKLLQPAADRIEKAERLLILPDGPLHYLHFAALARPDEADPRGWQYLAEWKPVHTAQSATVFAELKKRRCRLGVDSDNAEAVQWVGLGDPEYPVKWRDLVEKARQAAEGMGEEGAQIAEALPPASSTEGILRSTVERGIWNGLTELPYSEREINEIAEIFPEGQARALLGKDATEDEARKLLGNARIVHLATHGLAHPEVPMDSFLALSLHEPEGQQHNGLLQAWEIVNHLDLDADLVVLSACETAFGPDRGGEGLFSLSRAFQIAGARSVLASLWAVNDLSTSELMIRFYTYLQEGESKDRALQRAQLDLIRGPVVIEDDQGVSKEYDFSAPKYWAAFQLIGDWM